MTIETLRAYLNAKPGAEESFPFGPETLVFKVGGKMFSLVGWDEEPLRVTLKAEPDEAKVLRAEYPDAVAPGYYMNKRHWNTITLSGDAGGSIPDDVMNEMINASYALVVKSLTRAERAELSLPGGSTQA